MATLHSSLQESNRMALRLGLGALGIALLLLATWVSETGTMVVDGRFLQHYVSVIEGTGAQACAIALAAFGIALFAPWFRRSAFVTAWTVSWVSIGVAVPLAFAIWAVWN